MHGGPERPARLEGRAIEIRRGPADRSSCAARDRTGPALGVARLRVCLDVRLARAMAGTVRYLLADPRHHEVGDRWADGHQPLVPGLGGNSLAVRDAER